MSGGNRAWDEESMPRAATQFGEEGILMRGARAGDLSGGVEVVVAAGAGTAREGNGRRKRRVGREGAARFCDPPLRFQRISCPRRQSRVGVWPGFDSISILG